MPTNISKLSINAMPQKVWDVLTLPEWVSQWQYGSKLLTSWEVGSSVRFITEWEGTVFEQWGTVLECEPHQQLRYSLFAPRPGLEDKLENYFEMVYTLSEQNGSTNLEIAQIDDRPNAVQEKEQNENNPILKMLKDLAEKM